MISLPEAPSRIARLPKSERGYPIPWFVWINEEGVPDFRIIGPGKLADAYNNDRCWICGSGLLGHARVYTIGPMCVINRTTSEPASHRECAEYAAKACPFLTNPREKRDTKNMVENRVTAGVMIDRNPGATALYQTGKPKAFRAGSGVLFQLPAPVRVDWWARGRKATREEILDFDRQRPAAPDQGS